VDKVVSSVGAGDAMLAGYLSCPQGRSEALAAALQWGAAAVQNEGTLFSPNASSAQVTMSATIDLSRPLHDHGSGLETSVRSRITAGRRTHTCTKGRTV
jgi:1-phosphofructokinase